MQRQSRKCAAHADSRVPLLLCGFAGSRVLPEPTAIFAHVKAQGAVRDCSSYGR